MMTTFRNLGLSLLYASLIAGCTEDILVAEENNSATVPRALTQQCETNKTLTVGASYKLNNNIWGTGAGSQCVWYESSNGSWGANASHTSGTQQNIKGYPSLVRGWLWYNSTG